MKKTYIFILGIVFGLTISGVTVFASSLLSKDINFTPTKKDWEVTNVEEALTDLYKYSREDTINKLDFTTTTSESYGIRQTNRSTSLTVEAGNYIVVADQSTNYTSSTIKSSISSTSPLFNYTTGNCEKLGGKAINISGTTQFHTFYLINQLVQGIWKCNFTEKTTLTFTTISSLDETENGQTISAYAIKLD